MRIRLSLTFLMISMAQVGPVLSVSYPFMEIGFGFTEDSKMIFSDFVTYPAKFLGENQDPTKQIEIVKEELKSLNNAIQAHRIAPHLVPPLESYELKETFKKIGVDIKLFLNDFHIDLRLGFHILETLYFTFDCQNETEICELKVRGYRNPTRYYGNVYLMTPIGGFFNHRKIYRYFDVPEYAIFGPDGEVSARNCKPLGAEGYKCESVKNDDEDHCSTRNYEPCRIKNEMTPDGVYLKRYSQGTFLVTDIEKYQLFSNGTITWRQMPKSGTLFLRLKIGEYMKFGNFIEHGHCRSLPKISEIDFWPHVIPSLNHSEIEKWRIEDETKIDDVHFSEAHSDLGYGLNMDTISYFWNSGLRGFVIWWLPLILTAVGLCALWIRYKMTPVYIIRPSCSSTLSLDTV